MAMHTSVYTKSITQLGRLVELYGKKQVSNSTAQTINKLFDDEISQARIHLRETERDLAAYEEKFGMTSQEFIKKYQAGQTDDSMESIEWASLVQMADRIRQRLDFLTNEN